MNPPRQDFLAGSSGGERSTGSILLFLPVFSPGMVTKRFLRLENLAQIRPLSATKHSSHTTAVNDLRVLFTITYITNRERVVVPWA